MIRHLKRLIEKRKGNFLVRNSQKNSLIEKETSALLIVDLQERILNPIPNKDEILFNTKKIVSAFNVFEEPVYATEQYPEKLGSTIELESDLNTFNKRSFSCCNCIEMLNTFKKQNIKSLIICGIETHVCILQSCIELLNLGFEIYLLADAIGSRRRDDHEIGLNRLEKIGVKVYSTEAVIFELCKTSENIHFKALSKIIKQG